MNAPSLRLTAPHQTSSTQKNIEKLRKKLRFYHQHDAFADAGFRDSLTHYLQAIKENFPTDELIRQECEYELALLIEETREVCGILLSFGPTISLTAMNKS